MLDSRRYSNDVDDLSDNVLFTITLVLHDQLCHDSALIRNLFSPPSQ